MGRRRIFMAGREYGKVKVLPESRRGDEHREWKCRCECGNEFWARADNLRAWRVKSCGACGYAMDDPVEAALATS